MSLRNSPVLAFLSITKINAELAIAADFTGPAVSVLDGDTLKVLHAQATHDQIMVEIIST